MRILTPTIIANNESQPSTAGALLRIHDQDATSGESLLIVSSDDSDYYFKVASNGRVHFRGNATDGDGQIKVHLQHSGFTGAASSLIWDSSGGVNQMSIRQSEEDSDLFVYAHAQSLNLAEFARTTADVTFNAQVTVNGQGSDILDLYDNAATPVNVFKVQNDGIVKINDHLRINEDLFVGGLNTTPTAQIDVYSPTVNAGDDLLILRSSESPYYMKVRDNGVIWLRGNSTTGSGSTQLILQHSGNTNSLAYNRFVWDNSAGSNQFALGQYSNNGDLKIHNISQGVDSMVFSRTTGDVTLNGNFQLGSYGSGTITGTAAYTLAVDSSGNVIEITGGNTDTTYDLASAQNGTDVDVTLTGSDATTDTVTLVAGDAITLTDDGSNNVTIATDGTAESTHIAVKNTSGSTITKGTPVYITGNVGASDRLQIAAADASDAAKMPAVGLLETDLANNGQGFVVQGGYLRNITTDVIDGTSTSSNDTVYVKAGGGLTMTKPTGSTNYIQNIAKVARVGSGSSGSLIVSSILRTNDVPNLSTGKIWVGDSNTVESTVVHLDETNSRMGINDTSPSHELDVNGIINVAGDSAPNGTGLSFGFDSSNSYKWIQSFGSQPLSINPLGNNVGIGTTSPSFKLDVNGTFRSNAIWTSGSAVTYWGSGSSQTIYGGLTWGTGYATVFSNSGNVLHLGASGVSADVTIDTTGDVGIGIQLPEEKLHVEGNVRADSFGVEGSSTSNPTRVFAPSGAEYRGTGTVTGAVVVTLPQSWTNTMINFTINIYDYSDDESIKIKVSGYNYSPSTQWYQTTAVLESPANKDKNLQVRFGHDGTKCVVVIGTTSSTWSYPNISVSEFFAGHSNTELEKWNDGWDISTITSETGYTFTSTKSNTQVNNWVRSGQNLYYGSGTGNVGIGTTSPNALLNLGANSSYSTLFYADDVNIKTRFSGTNDQTQEGIWVFKNTGTWGQTRFYIEDANNLDSRLTLDIKGNQGSTDILAATSTGKIGIGTSSPSAKTHIVGGAAATNATALLVENSDGTDLLKVRDGGTSTLNGILDVNGSVDIDGSSSGALNVNISSGSYPIRFSNATSTADVYLGISGSSNGFILYVNSANRLEVKSDGQLQLNDYTSTTHDGTPTSFLGVDASGNVVKTTSSGVLTPTLQEVTDEGNTTTNAISIGHSNTPAYFIDVQNSTGATLARFKDSDSTHTGIVIAGDVNGGWVGSDFFTNGIYYQDSIDALRIYSNSAERMRITSTGNVGIGTASPSGQLHIKNASGTNGLIIQRGNDNTTPTYQIVTDSTKNVIKANGEITYRVAALGGTPTEKMRIDTSGNVGIGTTSPSAKLDIRGTGGDMVKILDSNNANNGFIFNTNLTSGYSSTFRLDDTSLDIGHNSGSRAITFSNGGNTRMFIKHTGDIGIGTSSPSAKIEVSGDGDIIKATRGSYSVVTNMNSGNNNITSTGKSFILQTSDSNPISLYTNGTLGLTIDTSQNVGIGTSGQGAKLHIVGSGNTTSTTALLVESNNGTDRLRVTDGDRVFINSQVIYYGADAENTTSGCREQISIVVYPATAGTYSIYTSESNKTVVTIDYVINDGTNYRTGTVTAITDGTTASVTDIVKGEVGNTSGAKFISDLVSGNVRVRITLDNSGWDAKYIVKNF